MKNTMRASSGVTNKLSLVYPYTPLEENFQDLDEQQAEHSGVEEEEAPVVDWVPSNGGGGRGEGTSSSSSRPLLLIGCAKTGLWGLKYREENAEGVYAFLPPSPGWCSADADLLARRHDLPSRREGISAICLAHRLDYWATDLGIGG